MVYVDRFDRNSTALQVLHNENLEGKIYLITGATKGIGYEVARCLALHGATIIFCGSSSSSCQLSKIKLLHSVPNADIHPLALDLTCLNDVKSSCDFILASFTKLDGLILSAGIGKSERRLTEDGLDKIFQVNYLAHFYMTLLLSPILEKGARIVCLTSKMYKFSGLSLDNLGMQYLNPRPSFKSDFSSYANSKLCLILMINELARKLGPKGIYAYSVHPGVVFTEIHGWFLYIYFSIFHRSKTPGQGAAGAVYAAISNDLIDSNGGFIVDARLDNLQQENAKDVRLGHALWKFSTDLLKSKKLL